MIVAEVAIKAAEVNLLIPVALKTGYNVANKIIAKFEALGTTRERMFDIKKTIGTNR